MKRGSKPHPTAIKRLRGNPGRRGLNRDEPKPQAPQSIEPPAELSPPERKHWQRLAPILLTARLLTEVDLDALRLLCISAATLDEAHEQVKKFGLVIKAPTGFPVQSPYLAIRNKAHEQVCKLLAEFGITPSSRSRVSVPPAQSDSPWEQLKAAAHAGTQNTQKPTTH